MVDKVAPLISEVMGKRSGEEFHKLYELDDDEDVLAGARTILYELMGKPAAEKRLKEIIKNEG